MFSTLMVHVWCFNTERCSSNRVCSGSKVDMRKYIEGVVEHQLQCEIRRYSTESPQMRWPGLGAQEHDIWFTCTIRHTDGVFIITSFLRHTPATPTPGQAHYLNWAAIADRAALTTSSNADISFCLFVMQLYMSNSFYGGPSLGFISTLVLD